MAINVSSLISKFIKERHLENSQDWACGYSPQYLSQVTQVYSDGTVDLYLAVYLPEGDKNPEAFAVEVNVDGTWKRLSPPDQEHPVWWLQLENIAEGTEVTFRYKKSGQDWQPIVPLNNLANRYEKIYVPSLTYQWQHQPPNINQGRVLLETTLEGLLFGYKNGKYAPNNRDEDLVNQSLASRILKTDLPGCLADLGIDEIMAPVGASVANRSSLNPKYNYLTYNFVELDWQIGSPQEFKKLVDRFYKENIQIIPDLIFAHQVKKPFPGSMDEVEGLDNTTFVDYEAYLFRDYGTWMLNLAIPELRRMLIEKIISFIKTYHLKIIRIDYIDGLILQYCQRDENYAEQFLRELKAELRNVCPEVLTLGETFEVSQNPVVQDFIDIFYAPMGFSIVEELYKPVAIRDHHLVPNTDAIAHHISDVVHSQRPEAVYAQLHDETWFCPHILAGRPHVNWAYGGHPAQLAKNQGQELIELGALNEHHLLDYVRRTVRLAEAMTMFIARSRYMFTPGVDSLSLGALDDPQEWKVTWEGMTPEQSETWQETGLSPLIIYQTHEQHRRDMIKLRNIFRHYTKLNEEGRESLIFPEMHHSNSSTGLICVFRRSHFSKEESLLIVFNLGTQTFAGDERYELPVPEGFFGQWQVIFDGESLMAGSQSVLEQFQTCTAYQEGIMLDTTTGQYSNNPHVIPLKIGARSLVVLRYNGE
ncbi:hypothetical protein FRE64_02820 [Euhalothece natronophila Z-M001]|uniref:Alpha-amylase n=1 Tax=Euhalothece natronophila Z-M001 TaxID=522448 RepID=A0A5B8NKX7_9CHRO|nr:hypothetical protein [Euhalothece natronophila]QDZ38965.1 hypothetical protein FRE64_02820 [Euhalothece natronophila Z-M001]